MRSRRTLGVVLGVALVLTVAPVVSALAQDDAVDSDDLSPAGMVSRVATVVQPPAIEPVTVLFKKSSQRKKSERGNRWVEISATGSNDVPEAALRAYKNAAGELAGEQPGCQLPWTLLAAIGRVESDHGRYGGSALGSDGVSRPAIVGLPLNGVGPVAAIHDTDNGKLDGDKVWDRAVGQMQFIPGTWRRVAADGDGDGVESPNDIDDAALAAGKYLCWGGFSVADASGMARAIFSYNHSDYYVALVMAFQRGYETGVFILPSPPPPPGSEGAGPGRGKKKNHHPQPAPAPSTGNDQSSGGGGRPGSGGNTGGGKPGAGGGGGGGGGGTSTPTPTSPSPSPTPPPPPPPPTVQLSYASGSLTACDGGYCLGGQKLGFGPDDQLGRQAAHDYDGDGATETNGQELAGLAESGASVRLGFEVEAGVAVVYLIGEHDYRFADGSFA